MCDLIVWENTTVADSAIWEKTAHVTPHSLDKYCILPYRTQINTVCISFIIGIFTHLKFCLADTIPNSSEWNLLKKWTKIQIYSGTAATGLRSIRITKSEIVYRNPGNKFSFNKFKEYVHKMADSNINGFILPSILKSYVITFHNKKSYLTLWSGR